MDEESIIIIGAGGIASCLLRQLRKFRTGRFTIIDGDTFEESNKSRQEGSIAENKAKYWSKELEETTAIEEYLTPDNISKLIPANEKTIIMSCVDNHKTRKLLQDHCVKMKNVVMISGGNDLTTGDVSLFVRENRRNLTPRIDFMQPEMENPKDRRPDEIGCGELVKSKPQIILTNNFVAAVMLNILQEKTIKYTTVYVDVEKNLTATVDTRKINGWK